MTTSYQQSGQTMAKNNPITEQQFQFHMQEHQLLRQEIHKFIDDLRAVQRNVTVSLGLFIAWFLSYQNNLDPALALLAAWFPFLMCLLFGRMSIVRLNTIFQTANYIAKIEKQLRHKSLTGWENNLQILRKDKKHAFKSSRMDRLFWLCASLFSFIFGLLISYDLLI
jgi:hypothetical protein